MTHDALLATTDAWIAGDPDPATQHELRDLRGVHVQALTTGSVVDHALAVRMSERLEFGTAGLRGLVGAGPGRLNRATSRPMATSCTSGWRWCFWATRRTSRLFAESPAWGGRPCPTA